MKIHKLKLYCGSSTDYMDSIFITDDNKRVTCKKCLRLIADNKPSKMYKIEYDYIEVAYIEAPTASKAIYKLFKQVYYYDEGENIGEQFQSFRTSWKPKAKIEKDSTIKRTLSDEEKQQIKIDDTNKFKDEFNKNFPIGTDVLFQADGKEYPIVTQTRSEAVNNNGTYLVIWVEGEGSSYLLDDRFIRILTDENINIGSLR